MDDFVFLISRNVIKRHDPITINPPIICCKVGTSFQIINPKTEKPIYTDSPITKYILYSCYYHNNIKDVEDVAEIDTLCDKPPAIKKNYNDILTECKDLKLNYTEWIIVIVQRFRLIYRLVNFK